MCRDVDLDDFQRIATPAQFDPWQLFGGCTIDLGSDGTSVYARAVNPTEHPAADKKVLRSDMLSGRPVFTYADPPHSCEAVVQFELFYMDVTADTNGTRFTEAMRCRAVAVLAQQVATLLASNDVPHRHLPHPTVSEFDYCQLLQRIDLSAVPKSGVEAQDESLNFGHYFLSTECAVDGGNMSFYIYPFIAHDPNGLYGHAAAGGHSFRFAASGDAQCRVVSEQGSADSAEEAIMFEADRDPDASSQVSHEDLCRAAQAVGAATLDEAVLS